MKVSLVARLDQAVDLADADQIPIFEHLDRGDQLVDLILLGRHG